MNKFKTFGAVLLAASLPLGHSAGAANIGTDAFSAETTILDLNILGLVGATVGTTGSGTAQTPAVDDITLAQGLVGASLVGLPLVGNITADVDVGVLSIDWISPDTFQLIFLLDATVDLGILGDLSLGLNLVPTIDWELTDLDFTPAESITGVTQIDNDFGDVIATSIGFTADSISITTGALLGTGVDINGGVLDGALTFQVQTGAASSVVPLPLPALLLVTGLAGFGLLRHRRGTTAAA